MLRGPSKNVTAIELAEPIVTTQTGLFLVLFGFFERNLLKKEGQKEGAHTYFSTRKMPNLPILSLLIASTLFMTFRRLPAAIVGMVTLLHHDVNTEPLTLKLLQESPNVKCLDGSSAGYYINQPQLLRNGHANTGNDTTPLVIFLEGGGACFNKAVSEMESGRE